MRTRWLQVLLLAACLLLSTAGVAWAHVTVQPEEVPADDYEVLTVRVPTEKDIPTTGVRVEVPEGFSSTSRERPRQNRASTPGTRIRRTRTVAL
jgi:uncharacterized protein YcnI